MAKGKSADEPIIIKKYANRRLYDTSTSAYITLDHLSDLVKKDVEFLVVNAKTGEDLTRQVLTQIIFEQETRGEGAMPTNFLRQLIRFYGENVQSVLPAWLDMSMNSFADRQEKWKQTVGKTFPMNPLGAFEEQTKRNVALFEKTMKMMVPTAHRSNGRAAAKPSAGRPTQDADLPDMDVTDPFSIMRAQMSIMQAQLDALSKTSSDD
ncbi:MAG: polyhydroxyalkanoate synthesis repressor PhaR [Hyphomonadaceae bacterium]